jgi:GTPase Era involved in 16S rRNA processing
MGSDVSRVESVRKWINVAIVGQTGVGKGSFINAIRGISEIKENFTNVTHGILPGPLIINKYGYPDDENPIIYFYDTGGFGDAYNEKYKLEEWLKRYQRDHRLKFDAIIFMIDACRLRKCQLKALKDQNNKKCPIFFVVNQVDVLKFKIDNEEEFKNQKEKIKRDILEVFKLNGVNKYSYTVKNIYLISSQASIFENEDLSPDGKRLKYDLEFFHFYFLNQKYDF